MHIYTHNNGTVSLIFTKQEKPC